MAKRANGNGRRKGYIHEYNPQKKTKKLLKQAQEVLHDEAKHLPLTMRQIFYQLVGKHDFPKYENSYDKLLNHVANARRAGWISFADIRDDGVTSSTSRDFDSVKHFITSVTATAREFTLNKMNPQQVRIEIWCESAGMLPQIERVAREYSVQCFSSGGFNSLTAKKAVADRISSAKKPTIIMHLGDYDPSGLSIFEDFEEDVRQFVLEDAPEMEAVAQFKRIALTKQQVTEYDLPTAPPKKSDAKSKTWSDETCQLEAIPSSLLEDIVRDAIEAEIDLDLLEKLQQDEIRARETLAQVLNRVDWS